MKNIFAYQVEEKSQKERMDGAAFITKEIPPEARQKLTSELENAKKLINTASLPWWQTALEVTAAFIALAIGAGIIRNIFNLSIIVMYHHAPWVFWLFGACLVVAIFFALKARRLKAGFQKSEQVDERMRQMEEKFAEAAKATGLPADAVPIDVMGYYYRLKNGREKRLGTAFSKYVNFIADVYEQDGCLCFWDVYHVISVPLAQIRGVETVKERTTLRCWNKKETVYSQPYKKYKLRQDSAGVVYIKGYGRIKIGIGSDEYEVLIPDYDLDKVLKWVKNK